MITQLIILQLWEAEGRANNYQPFIKIININLNNI